MQEQTDKHVQRVEALPTPVGRGTNGQFLSGNPGGPGNPNRGKIERLRHQLLEETDPQRIGRIWDKALTQAEAGDKDARKFVFDRLFGKVAQPILTNGKDGNGQAALMLQLLRGDPELLAKMNDMARSISERNNTNGT